MSNTKTERCPTCRSKCIVTGNTTKYFVPLSTERMEKQLAERDEVLARCVEALWSANETLWNNALNDAAINLEKVIASIPASARATAKVLADARRL